MPCNQTPVILARAVNQCDDDQPVIRSAATTGTPPARGQHEECPRGQRNTNQAAVQTVQSAPPPPGASQWHATAIRLNPGDTPSRKCMRAYMASTNKDHPARLPVELRFGVCGCEGSCDGRASGPGCKCTGLRFCADVCR